MKSVLRLKGPVLNAALDIVDKELDSFHQAGVIKPKIFCVAISCCRCQVRIHADYSTGLNKSRCISKPITGLFRYNRLPFDTIVFGTSHISVNDGCHVNEFDRSRWFHRWHNCCRWNREQISETSLTCCSNDSGISFWERKCVNFSGCLGFHFYKNSRRPLRKIILSQTKHVCTSKYLEITLFPRFFLLLLSELHCIRTLLNHLLKKEVFRNWSKNCNYQDQYLLTSD